MPKRRALHFKSKASYGRWIRYAKWEDGGKKSKHPAKVYIRGRVHHVKHTKKRRRR